MVFHRFSLLSVLALAAVLAPAPVHAVQEGALLGRMGSSSTLHELEQQLKNLSEMQMGMSSLSEKDFRKRKRDLETAVRKENARIRDLGKACKDLFAKGGRDVHSARDKQGRTLLMLVASLGNDEATSLVLADNPPLNPVDKDGRTALNYETEGGGTALRQYVDAKWKAAITSGDAEAAAELLECGVNASDAVDGEPPLAIAIRNKNATLLALLASENPGTVMRSREGFTLLELAARTDNPGAVSTLLTIGADDGTHFSGGTIPLFYMATMASTACFESYVSVSQQVDKALLPSFITRVGSPDKIRSVVRDAATANKEDANGNIPIHEAARRGNPEVFRLLLELGGSRTATNSRGETTLMHAALSGNLEVVQMALEGLDQKAIQQNDKKGGNAANYAVRSGNRDVCGMMGAVGLKPKK